MIGERDLAGLADADEELDRVVGRLIERRPDIKPPVPGGLLPLRGDQARPLAGRRRACRGASSTPDRGCASSPTPAAASRRPSREGEDACLAALVPGAAGGARRTPKPSLLVVGAARRRAVEDQAPTGVRRRSASADGQAFLPGRSRSATCRRSDPATKVILLAQPWLGETVASRWRRAGRRR
jgi:light-independent protochlorophyllide reductase subunit N